MSDSSSDTGIGLSEVASESCCREVLPTAVSFGYVNLGEQVELGEQVKLGEEANLENKLNLERKLSWRISWAWGPSLLDFSHL